MMAQCSLAQILEYSILEYRHSEVSNSLIQQISDRGRWSRAQVEKVEAKRLGQMRPKRKSIIKEAYKVAMLASTGGESCMCNACFATAINNS